VALILGRPLDLGLQPAFCIAECDAINFRTDADKISLQDIPLRQANSRASVELPPPALPNIATRFMRPTDCVERARRSWRVPSRTPGEQAASFPMSSFYSANYIGKRRTSCPYDLGPFARTRRRHRGGMTERNGHEGLKGFGDAEFLPRLEAA
jgi:hypothetical protein